MTQTRAGRQRVRMLLAALGGASLVVAAFVPWVARGHGSSLRGHELIDALVALGRHVPAFSQARLTVLWYLVPALGATSWIALGLAGPSSRPTRTVAAVALATTLACVWAFGRLADYGDFGLGPWLAISGAALLNAATWWPPSRAPRSSAPTGP